MDIAYTAICPTCKAGGSSNRLHRNLSDPDVLFCPTGHKFQGPEIEEYLTAEPSVEPIKFVEPPPHTGEVLAKELEESMQKSLDTSFAMAPPPVDAPIGSSSAKAVEDVKEAAAAKIVEHSHKVATAVAEPEPGAQQQPEPVARPSQPKKPIRKLPGGALELTVVIQDPHASYLAAEAEFRGKTVQEHFEEIMIAGMDARWWY